MKYYVYTITCKINNKIYVGYTNNFVNRKRQHLGFLKNNNHANIHLQSAYNLYGEENFTIEILVTCNKEIACSEEHYWCNLLNTHDNNFGYNIAPTNPEKISSGQSKESIEKIKKKLTGRTLSASHLINMTNARIGSKNSEKSKIKVKKWFEENGHPSKGVKRSQEVRDKMSAISKNKPKVKRRKRLICIENESKISLFESVRDLISHYQVSTSSLYKNLNNELEYIMTKSNIKINTCYESKKRIILFNN